MWEIEADIDGVLKFIVSLKWIFLHKRVIKMAKNAYIWVKDADDLNSEAVIDEPDGLNTSKGKKHTSQYMSFSYW